MQYAPTIVQVNGGGNTPASAPAPQSTLVAAGCLGPLPPIAQNRPLLFHLSTTTP